MKKIKILYILPQQNIGGAETQMINLIKGLDKDIFDIYVGIIYGGKELEKEFKKILGANLILFNKKNRFDIRVFFNIAGFIRKEKIDIVQTFLSNHHAYLPVFMAGRGIPIGGIRSTYSGEESFIDRMFRFDITRLAVKLKKMCLIANSHAGRDIYLQHNFPKDRIFVIPNGIDVQKFSKGQAKKVRREFHLENKIVLGMISRLDKRKNHEELLEVFYYLQKKFTNLVLLIVGDGPHMSNLKRIVSEKGMGSSVIFTGMRKDIPDILHSMDIFVFPSKFPEGWPNAVGEAMCAGVPVISYSCGDIKHILKNGYDGVITRPASIRVDITLLIKDKKYRAYLSSNAKKKILHSFTVPIMVKSYEKIYKYVLGDEINGSNR